VDTTRSAVLLGAQERSRMDDVGRIDPRGGDFDHDVQHIANTFQALGQVHCILHGPKRDYEMLLTSVDEVTFYGATPAAVEDSFYHLSITNWGATWLKLNASHHTGFLSVFFKGLTDEELSYVVDFLDRFEVMVKEFRAP
jgi:hypothetical protein